MVSDQVSTRLAVVVLVWLVGAVGMRADAGDGLYSSCCSSTYYETILSELGPGAFLSTEPALPKTLYVDAEEEAEVVYRRLSTGDLSTWQFSVGGFSRRHERVSAIYHLVLAIPLPTEEDGSPAWLPLQWEIAPRASLESGAPRIYYQNRPLSLTRSILLERIWLPQLIGAAPGKLPDLENSGYGWTLWDTVVRHDPDAPDEIMAALSFRYSTDGEVAAPDPGDDRFGTYFISWIPTLIPEVAPYAIRSSLDRVEE